MMPDVAWTALRVASRLLIRSKTDLHVEGLEHLPRKGPCIIAARHYHHLYDGATLIATVPYPLHILVGLDWVRNPVGQKAMHALCDAAGWPVVLRRDGQHTVDDDAARRALRKAYRDSLDILRRGHALLVFPEGYPNIDPGYTPKTSPEQFLPFQPGFAQIAAGAARIGIDATVIPAGFSYRKGERWDVALRFGPPVAPSGRSTSQLVAEVEEAVIRLSTPPN